MSCFSSLSTVVTLVSISQKSLNSCRFRPQIFLRSDYNRFYQPRRLSSLCPLKTPSSSASASESWTSQTPSEGGGGVALIDFEDYGEKDWSFLESEECHDRIISAAGGEIGGSSSRSSSSASGGVLVSMGSEGFVDRLVECWAAQRECGELVVVHDSLMVLAGIKEKHDGVKCWQGELTLVPQKWGPFDAVFLYFLPALPFGLAQVLEALAKCCLPGARVVISHHQGRRELEKQRLRYPDIVVSDLPDKYGLQDVASDHSFELTEFVDEPGFYLAVLRYLSTGQAEEP